MLTPLHALFVSPTILFIFLYWLMEVVLLTLFHVGNDSLNQFVMNFSGTFYNSSLVSKAAVTFFSVRSSTFITVKIFRWRVCWQRWREWPRKWWYTPIPWRTAASKCSFATSSGTSQWPAEYCWDSYNWWRLPRVSGGNSSFQWE